MYTQPVRANTYIIGQIQVEHLLSATLPPTFHKPTVPTGRKGSLTLHLRVNDSQPFVSNLKLRHLHLDNK